MTIARRKPPQKKKRRRRSSLIKSNSPAASLTGCWRYGEEAATFIVAAFVVLSTPRRKDATNCYGQAKRMKRRAAAPNRRSGGSGGLFNFHPFSLQVGMIGRADEGTAGGVGEAHRHRFRFHLFKLLRADVALHRQVVTARLQILA